MIIAIDGPAASGKGTLARRLAAHFGLRHLDTGLLYRAVAKALLDAGADLEDERQAVAAAQNLDAGGLNEASLKGRGMAEPASIVSTMPRVREALVELQRNFAAGVEDRGEILPPALVAGEAPALDNLGAGQFIGAIHTGVLWGDGDKPA